MKISIVYLANSSKIVKRMADSRGSRPGKLDPASTGGLTRRSQADRRPTEHV